MYETKENAEATLRSFVNSNGFGYYVDVDLLIDLWIGRIKKSMKDGSEKEFEKKIFIKLLKIKILKQEFNEKLKNVLEETD